MSTGTTTGTTTATPTGTGTPRKLRGDAKLAQLHPEQREFLRVWLEDDNETYSNVVRLVHHHFGLQVSRSAVGAYYQRHVVPDRYDGDSEAAALLAALPTGEFDAATIRHAKALAFSLIIRPTPHLDTATRLLDLVHRVEKQQLAAKRYALDERRLALREAEHAARPPRQPRHSPASDGGQPRAAASEKPPKPSRSPRPAPPQIDAAPLQLAPAPEPSALPDAPVNSAPELPPAATQPPPPSCALPATHTSPLSEKIPPDSPRFPAYSKLAQPFPAPSPATPSAHPQDPSRAPQAPALLCSPPVLGSSPVKTASEPASTPPVPPRPQPTPASARPAVSATPAWLTALAVRL